MWPFYEEACADGLTRLGCAVEPYVTSTGIVSRDSVGRVMPHSVLRQVQHHLLLGPAFNRINAELSREAERLQPDVLFFHNTTSIFPSTVVGLKKALPAAIFAQYSNDCPFVDARPFSYWRHFRANIRHMDVSFAYRGSDVPLYRSHGAKDVHLLRSYYVAKDDCRLEVGPADVRFRNDVVFAGHFADDGRREALESIARAGHRIGVFGAGWTSRRAGLKRGSPLSRVLPIRPVLGDDYRKAISGARIALCFLSKRNRDTYTRRNFQIPAMGTFMLSEYSDDLATLFQEGHEAEYFRSNAEMLDKIAYYLRNDEVRERVAARGHARLLRDGHEVRNRMSSVLQVVQGVMK